ncbi:MAG TPA: hypothetical protein PKG56_04200, partial [Chitinophagaceae bacterium]|nr:hypothetical protein [Chitinophagaceae bacterium]HMZ46584.1 hypothetical protein [Chitinophagaceae bacterium]HNE94261.1 hypothetical protein [Chitinophagaceae bacterium]HNL82570.1 hypothetical protein [Chitinophagaceae bacterium]HNM35334.1 hypothetical protein [Chitinophagaceae bacterium]
MNFRILIAVVFMLSCNFANAQKMHSDSTYRKKHSVKTFTQKPAQVVFAELGGNSLIWTINYDRRFSKRLDGWGFKIGAGYFPLGGSNLFVAPVGINILTGAKGHFLETGFNISFVSAKNKNKTTPKPSLFGQIDFSRNQTYLVYGVPVGYRWHKTDKPGVSFRAGVEPLIGKRIDDKFVFALTGHLSIGYSF